jgi:hypothetical protein
MSETQSNVVSLVNQRPSYLSDTPTSDNLRELSKVAKPPRLKVIQAMTGEPYKPPFKEGDCIIVPQMEFVCDETKPATIVPIYYFRHFILTNPAQMKGQVPFIREQTYDEKSDLARKALTFKTMPFPENPKLESKYQSVLNFIVDLPDHPEMAGLFPILAFRGGEFKYGQILIGMIQARKVEDFFACRFRITTGDHKGKMGTWKGLDFDNDPNPWVDEAHYNIYKERHLFFNELVKNRQIEVDLDDTDVTDDTTSDPSKETKF